MGNHTEIHGWISLGVESEQNRAVLDKFDEHFPPVEDEYQEAIFPNIFAMTTLDYASFSGSVNHCDWADWLESFEKLLEMLDAYDAIVFMCNEIENRKIRQYRKNAYVSSAGKWKYIELPYSHPDDVCAQFYDWYLYEFTQLRRNESRREFGGNTMIKWEEVMPIRLDKI